MKTIQMRPDDLDEWVDALHSSKYVQNQYTGNMYDPVHDAYSPLGVLQMCISGDVEDRELPSEEWLQDHDIVFLDEDGDITQSPVLGMGMDVDTASITGIMAFSEIAEAILDSAEWNDGEEDDD